MVMPEVVEVVFLPSISFSSSPQTSVTVEVDITSPSHFVVAVQSLHFLHELKAITPIR